MALWERISQLCTGLTDALVANYYAAPTGLKRFSFCLLLLFRRYAAELSIIQLEEARSLIYFSSG